MKSTLVLAVLVTILLIPSTLVPALAQTTYVIKIPTGAADPNAPYFWQSEKDGDTSGKITIKKLDSVEWRNADTAAHTVTSGTAQEGPDGKFDSSLFAPGKSFKHQFTEVGEFDYFCLVHPWMDGTVFVQEAIAGGVKIIHGVGANVDDAGKGVNVEYMLDRKLSSASVDTTGNTLTFILAGQTTSDEFVIMLPQKLITNPNAVWVDNEQITNFESEKNGDITKLTIPLEENSEEVVIRGTAVIPEFGFFTVSILATAIIGTILFSAKARIVRI